MDTLNKLALDLFESKESYTTNDYLTIMNILMVQYHRLNGDIPTETGCNKELDSDDDEDEDDVSYSNYYADEEEGYLSDYIDPY